MSLSSQDKPNEETGLDTRARIMAEAERLFRHYGYSKTTVADIARELGMSSGNIYRFFASKAAINEAMAERMLAHRVAESAKIAKGRGSAYDRLRGVLLHNHRIADRREKGSRDGRRRDERAMGRGKSPYCNDHLHHGGSHHRRCR